ncbi:MAG TPA: hypothetical protein PK668_24270 [Myxococcota bacterium]|nr:hypothetical protein [Myxococcota bacterium]HRY95379.1 hypothetical protein [Myxococcota bacterium]HSA23525.1 hypothetical protein [Myxococcota bacterium]
MKRFSFAVCVVLVGVLCVGFGCESSAPRENACDPNPCVDENFDPLVAHRSLCTATSEGAICDCDWDYLDNADGVCAYQWCIPGCELNQHCEIVGSALAATCEANVCEPACDPLDVCVESADADGNQIFVCGCGAEGEICEDPATCVDHACT